MITKPLDRITEAYNGDMGEDFGRKTRNRINWIVNHTIGTEILDVGCSQGIVPIILGREGKIVDALDIAQESIEFALEKLATEHSSVQENVHFRVSNFMTDNQIKSQYQTILLSEVLEHISDPDIFLRKIYDHLESDGRLVVTVPFGINDYFDHKRTYYFLELNDHITKYFSIEKIDFLGKWTGVICTKKEFVQTKPTNEFGRDVVDSLEKAFYTVERELLTRVENFQLTMKEKNDYIKRIQSQYSQNLEEIKEQVVDRDTRIKALNEYINGYKLQEGKKLKELEEEKEINRKLLLQLKEQNIEFNSLIVNVENQHRRYIEKFEEQIVKAERENAELKLKLFDLQSQRDIKVDEEKASNRMLLQQIKDQNTELNSLFVYFENRSRSYLEKFEEQMLSSKREIEDLKQKLTHFQNQVVYYQEETELANNKNNKLIEKVETLINEYKDLELVTEELKTDNALLLKDLENEREKNEDKEREIAKLTEALNQQLAANKTLQDSKVENEAEIMRLYNVIEELRQKAATIVPNDLDQRINEKDVVIQQLNDQASKLKAELLNSLNSEEKALRLTLQEKAEINSQANLINKLENQLTRLEKKYLSLKESKLGGMTLKYWQLRKKLKKMV